MNVRNSFALRNDYIIQYILCKNLICYVVTLYVGRRLNFFWSAFDCRIKSVTKFLVEPNVSKFLAETFTCLYWWILSLNNGIKENCILKLSVILKNNFPQEYDYTSISLSLWQYLKHVYLGPIFTLILIEELFFSHFKTLISKNSANKKKATLLLVFGIILFYMFPLYFCVIAHRISIMIYDNVMFHLCQCSQKTMLSIWFLMIGVKLVVMNLISRLLKLLTAINIKTIVWSPQ